MPSGKPTLRDVAKAAGFSPMTASNALHGKPGVKDSTRAKVLAVAEKLDYRINLTASMLKSGRSNIIHIIVNEFDSPFYSKLVESLVTETTARGLTPFVEQTRYSPDAAKHALANNPFSGQLFDGEIIHASGLNAGVPLSAINHGRPLVLIDACEETPTFDTVNFPNEDGARAAVQHLIECGCHRIAIVGDGYSPRTELAHVESSSGLRLRGASGALLDAGLPYDESTNFIGYGSDSGIEALDHLTGAADKLQRFAAIVGRIELCAIVKSTSVMCAAGFADVASCDFRHFKILQMILICGNGQSSSNGQFPVISDAYLSVY